MYHIVSSCLYNESVIKVLYLAWSLAKIAEHFTAVKCVIKMVENKFVDD